MSTINSHLRAYSYEFNEYGYERIFRDNDMHEEVINIDRFLVNCGYLSINMFDDLEKLCKKKTK